MGYKHVSGEGSDRWVPGNVPGNIAFDDGRRGTDRTHLPGRAHDPTGYKHVSDDSPGKRRGHIEVLPPKRLPDRRPDAPEQIAPPDGDDRRPDNRRRPIITEFEQLPRPEQRPLPGIDDAPTGPQTLEGDPDAPPVEPDPVGWKHP